MAPLLGSNPVGNFRYPQPQTNGIALPLSSALLRSMTSYARRQLLDDASAQDAVQETVAALLSRGSKFRGDSSFSTYVFAILRFKVVDIIRERARFVPVEVDGPDGDRVHLFETEMSSASQGATPVSIEESSDAVGLRQALQTALQSLSPRHRQIVMLREWFGLEPEEIGRRLDITPSNASVILCRAKQQLRRDLRRQGYGPTIPDEMHA